MARPNQDNAPTPTLPLRGREVTIRVLQMSLVTALWRLFLSMPTPLARPLHCCPSMSSAIDTVSPTSNVVTQITVRPNSGSGFFGANGPSFDDVLDTINPLKHIPIISDLMQGNSSAPAPSVASKLAGGLLFGGPIGFVASLVNEIFTEATGHGVAGAVYAALSGDGAATTQVADAGSTTTQVAQNATNASALTDSTMATQNATANTVLASNTTPRDQAVLDLYGNSAPSASRAYQKAQLLPYLREANTHQVM